MRNFASRLSVRQIKAVTALLTEDSIEKAAKKTGVNPATVYRWMEQDDFKAAVISAQSEAIQQFARSLVSMAELASQAIRDGLDPKQKIGTRLRAADIYTDRMMRIHELVGLEYRLTEMEKRLHAQETADSDYTADDETVETANDGDE